MDAKSLAKSKRAHSLHHSKKQHHISKGASASPSTSTGDKKGKQVKEKPVQGHGSRGLPSNWDRYFEEGEEELGFDAAVDVVAPKSKGADYGYLISEAMAQNQYSSPDVAPFDDVLQDFYQGFGPLLSTKGQSIASWIDDDIFGSEDKVLPPDEASFLSLNLHTLAEQLAKTSLSDRLFIEPDQLPQELWVEELQKLGESKQKEFPTNKTSLSEEVVDSSTPGNVSEDIESVHQFSRNQFSTAGTSSASMLAVSAGKNSKATGTEINVNSAAKKPSKFKVANAEAELDMLLGSFSETKFLESERTTEETRDNFVLPQNDVSEVKDTGLHRGMRDTKLDDFVDDLLRETSNPANKNEESQADEAKTKAAFRNTPSSSNPVAKSKLTDDFDSWFDTI